MITFSIVTPNLNQGQFLSDAFESILRQKGDFKIQYILVDGLSIDITEETVKKYKPKFKNKGIDFLYIREKDRGQSDAINKGFKRAKGDIFGYLNADDFYEDRALSYVVDAFDKNPEIQWVFGGWNFVNKEGQLFSVYQPTNFPEVRFRTYGFNIGQPSCFFRKNVFEKVGGFAGDLHLTMDYDLWLRLLNYSKPVIVPKILSSMRYHTGAKSSKNMLKHNHEAYLTAKKHISNNLVYKGLLVINYWIGYLMIRLGQNISQRIK